MWFDLAAVRFPPGEERELAVGNRDKIEKRMRLEQVAEAERLARQWKPK